MTLILSILLSAAYGFVVVHHHGAVADDPDLSKELAIANQLKIYSSWAIAGVFALHLFERFNRHVMKREPYWIFERDEKS
jgi:cell division protein FtsW (lipid II flippase)